MNSESNCVILFETLKTIDQMALRAGATKVTFGSNDEYATYMGDLYRKQITSRVGNVIIIDPSTAPAIASRLGTTTDELITAVAFPNKNYRAAAKMVKFALPSEATAIFKTARRLVMCDNPSILELKFMSKYAYDSIVVNTYHIREAIGDALRTDVGLRAYVDAAFAHELRHDDVNNIMMRLYECRHCDTADYQYRLDEMDADGAAIEYLRKYYAAYL